jgi:branched-chain amino acid aminotransferase
MSDLQVHLNGRLVPASEARISVFDAGLLHGASAFTTMLAHKGKVFRLRRHLRRLLGTCQLLGLRAGATEDALASAAGEVLRANGLAEARMRVTLTPGSVKEEQGGPTTLITAEPIQEYPKAWYEKGISVVISSYQQAKGDPTFGNKTGNYLTRMLARQEAARKGAEEALWYTTDNLLAEACFCNVFLVAEGTVRTPPRDTPVLPGIVREAVIELCGALGVPCDDQTPLTVREMLAAGEIFLTSSTAGIRPVARVERHPVGEEKPGPITRRLMDAYAALLERECA